MKPPTTIDLARLASVTGGAAKGQAELTAALTSIKSTISDVAAAMSKPKNDMMPMLMMMMMGGLGGGGGGAAQAAAAPAPEATPLGTTQQGPATITRTADAINVSVKV